jgi:hypothetical protein
MSKSLSAKGNENWSCLQLGELLIGTQINVSSFESTDGIERIITG